MEHVIRRGRLSVFKDRKAFISFYKRGEIETMIGEFFYENWVALLIALLAGLPLFFLTLLFLKYERKSKRYKKAKETVIDNLESLFINNKSVSPEIIKHLISATEREQNIELKDTPKNLLEDLELRFEKNKHLNTERRTYYIEQIEELISKIESESKISSVPLSYENVLTSLKENIEKGKKDAAFKDLDELSIKIRRLDRIAKYPAVPLFEPPAIYFFMALFIVYVVVLLLLIF